MANPYFNAAYYLANNPDLVAAGVDAETHYRDHGASEAFLGTNTDRKPAEWFDIQYYLSQNPDVAAAVAGNVAAAFDHFTTHGIGEGRVPSAAYDFSDAQWSDYAAANSDLTDAFGITDPYNMTDAQQLALVNHYYQLGWNEDRDADPILPTVGDTYTLTTGADDFTGTALDDVFDAALDDASGSLYGLLGIQTLGGQDKLDGGEGWDVLNAELNATGTTQNPTMTGIEELNLTVMPLPLLGAILPSFGALDLSRADGYREINNVDSRYDLMVDNARVQGEHAPVLGLDGVLGDTTFTVNYDFDEVVSDQQVVANRTGSASSGRVTLDINTMTIGSDPNFINTLSLSVSNGVYLRMINDAAWISNLIIDGTGYLDVRAQGRFNRLETLDSTGYDEGLDIDVSGSHILERVDMGDGDDRVVVHRNAVRNNDEDDNLSVDMGDGDDALAVAHVHNSGHITGLDFTGGVDNVETLEFVHGITQSSWSGGNAVLNLAGFDEALSTIQLDQTFNGNGHRLAIQNSPAELTIDALSHIRDMSLDIDAEALTINGHGVVDLDDLAGTTIRSLDINQTQDTSAPGWMNAVWADLDDSGGNLRNLEHVGITSEGYVSLDMYGAAGAAEIAGVQQVEQFTITGISGLPSARNGDIVFTSTDLDNGVLSVPFSVFGSLRNDQAATDIAAGLTASTDPFTATTPWFDNIVTLTWDDFGEKQPLNVFQENINSGVINVASTVIDWGVEHEDMIPGTGFEALEDIVVDAAWDADVYLEDVYGAFTVDVKAGEDIDLDMENTNVTSATVEAGDHAYVWAYGDTVGAHLLQDITVSAVTTDIYLADDLSSFSTLDLTGVTDYFVVDAASASYNPGALGNYVSYVVGTSSGEIDMAAAREMITFTESVAGVVILDGFVAGNDPTYGDRIDLSELGFTNNGQLVFETGDWDWMTESWTTDALGADVRITDLAGGPEFDGQIVITGVDAADIQAYNMHYA